MPKELEENLDSSQLSLRERVARAIEDVMTGDRYVIFPDGGVMPIKEPRLSPKTPDNIIIDNTV